MTLTSAYVIVGHALAHGSNCHQRLCSIVWNEEIEPQDFETEWTSVICDFDLGNHKWLGQLFKIRDMWIPAFFRDLPMCGLMKTTSRSESENKFFTSTMNPFISLVEFYLRYESCLDMQRHNQLKYDNESEHKRPERKTPLEIEKHAMNVYTNTIFYLFQKELEAALFTCGGYATKVENALQTHNVKCTGTSKIFEVQFHAESYVSSCSCKLFDMKGIPCRHILYVWRSNLLDCIPDQYILPRWCKFPFQKSLLGLELDEQCSSFNAKKNLINSLWSDMHACVQLASSNDDDLLKLSMKMKEYRAELESSKTTSSRAESKSKKIQDIEMLTGFSVPDEVIIKPPKVSKNKGTGIHPSGSRKDKRFKSAKEVAIESGKKLRVCGNCKELTDHDSRNCKKKRKI